MRLVSSAFDQEVAGSTSRDRLEANLWRDGRLLVGGLSVLSFSIGWDASRLVQGQASLSFADPDGSLAPWSLTDPLGPGGSRLQLTWVSGLSGTRVPLGWWRIRSADPHESWRLVSTSSPTTSTGAVVRVNLHPNPRGTSAFGWVVGQGGGSPTGASVTVSPPFAGGPATGYRATVTGAAATYLEARTANTVAQGIPVTAGQTLTVSVWGVLSYTSPVTAFIQWINAAGGLISSAGLPVGTQTAGAWVKYERTVTAPPLAVTASLLIRATQSPVPAGGQLTLTAAASDAGVWFDGSTRAAGTVNAWTGTPNASTSTQAPIVVSTTQSVQRVAGGGSVDVAADEETATAILNRLDAEVVVAPMCVAEVRRLLAEIVAVSVEPGVVDGPVPAALVYGEQRMDAVADLLGALMATFRMGADGSFQIVPIAGVGPVWTVAGGTDGVLVSLVRSFSDDGVFNAAVSTGETADGQPLIGRAYVANGPLRWGGPYGKVPVFHQAVAQTALGVYADAQTVLSSRLTAGEVDLSVTCLAHPAIQPNDRVTILAPTTAGDASVVGRVVSMSLRSAGAVPAKSMELVVRVSADALEAIASRVRAARA